MKARTKPRQSSTTSSETSDPELLASKLFSHLICHGKECRLEIFSVATQLQMFSGDNNYDRQKALEFVNRFRKKFVIKTVEGKQFVEGKTSINICDRFQDGKCRANDCEGLHICRFFLEENCKFGDECKNPHRFDIPQTRALLVTHKLENLSDDALKTLFQKVFNEKKIKHASSSSGPSACKFYNKGNCKNGDKCEFLHVCVHYIEGNCGFGGQRCERYHGFDTTHTQKVLAAHNFGGPRNDKEILAELQSNRSHASKSDNDDGEDGDDVSTGGSIEKLEICGFNLRGKCSYGDKCHALHTSLPYQWQYRLNSPWANFPADDNRKIEERYCNKKAEDVEVELAGHRSLSIKFQRMTGEIANGLEVLKVEVRRLSTTSSVLAPTGHVFSTTWKWYWQEEHNKWHSYDDTKAELCEKIEQKFQSEISERQITFSTDSQEYILYFGDVKNLFQQNVKHRTTREVRRRPAEYLDEKKMKQVLENFKQSRRGHSAVTVPSTWSPLDPSEEFKLVDLSEGVHHNEYSMIKAQFLTTMAGYEITSVKRVQNPGLWEDYERQKSRITEKNRQSPEERWLFHGTSKDIVKPICQQGFDWRLSGLKHGARYGKGSYFAVEASYSHNYSRAKAVDEKYMVFMAKVIVGSYVAGSYETQRPPAKDPSNPLSPLHDSCVNNVAQPTIFVVFERSQAYPYYIVDYAKKTVANPHSSAVSRQVPSHSSAISRQVPNHSSAIRRRVPGDSPFPVFKF